MAIQSQSAYTPIEKNALTGSAVGLAEVYFNHPFWTIKTRQQCGYPFTLNMRVLYRGAGAEACAMVPVDILQMIVSTSLNERVFNNKDNSSTPKRFTSGFISGMIGGTFINAIESIMTLQQKYSLNFIDTTHKLASQRNYRQLVLGSRETSMRNGIYNAGFFSLVPKINERMQAHVANPTQSVIISGALVGGGVAVISHPFDTIKTTRQADEGATSFLQAVRKIYMTRGVTGFFTGLPARGARVVSGISVMGLVYDKLEKTTVANL